MKKMTYVNAIENAINGIMDEETKNRLEALIDSLNRRNSKERKPTKAQCENTALKAKVAEFLRGTANGMQCKDIAAEFGVSGQKMSALLKQLVDAEVVEKFTEKRVTYFKAVDADEAQFLDGEVTF